MQNESDGANMIWTHTPVAWSGRYRCWVVVAPSHWGDR